MRQTIPMRTGKRGDIGADSGDGLVSFLAQEISRCRDDVSARTQPGAEEINGHNPVPENVYLSFHDRLLHTPVARRSRPGGFKRCQCLLILVDSSPTNPAQLHPPVTFGVKDGSAFPIEASLYNAGVSFA